jgi:hypothetical protein
LGINVDFPKHLIFQFPIRWHSLNTNIQVLLFHYYFCLKHTERKTLSQKDPPLFFILIDFFFLIFQIWVGEVARRLLKLGIDVWKGHTGVCERGLWIRKYQQAGTSIMGKVLMHPWNILLEVSRKILFYFSCGGVTYCIPGDIPKISIKLSMTQKLIMGAINSII